MVRHELDNGLAYGLDHATGVFLSVPDYLWEGDGGGDPWDGYYQFRTGLFGLGKRLSEKDMVEYMRRFNVTQKHILQFLGGWAQSVSSPKPPPATKREVKTEEEKAPLEKKTPVKKASVGNPPNKSPAIRYEAGTGNVRAAYGVESTDGAASGVFLTVSDKRLKSVDGESEEVDCVAKSIGVGGDGCYLALRTGAKGRGMQVSAATMEAYMRRFSVPDEHIKEIFQATTANSTTPSNSASDQPKVEVGLDQLSLSSAKTLTERLLPALDGTSGPCAHCGRKGAKLHCAKCWEGSRQHVYFCSVTCRQAGWSYHKHFCALMPPVKTATKRGVIKRGEHENTANPRIAASTPGQPLSIYGLLMRESAERPEFVEVPLSEFDDGHYRCMVPEFAHFFGCTRYEMGKSFMKVNSVKGNRRLPNTLMFLYRDNFLNDGSVRNTCVWKMLGKAPPHPWAGPVLVTKYKGNMGPGNENPIDVQLSDGADIIDFLKSYGADGKEEIDVVSITPGVLAIWEEQFT